MPKLDLILEQKDFAALAMAAHIEDMTLNDYVASCLRSAADHEIERLDKELRSAPEVSVTAPDRREGESDG